MAIGSTSPSVVQIGPYLDVRSVAAVRTTLAAVQAAAPGDVVIDMSAVEVIDAAGLGMLAAAHVRAQRNGHRLVLRACSRELRRMLAVTRLNRVLYLERTHLDISA